jgi:CRP-like cAMP-binding protein
VEWFLFSVLTDEDRRSVLTRCVRQRFSKGEAIFRVGDQAESLHLLSEGTVAISAATPQGDTVTLDVLAPGDAFGEQALVSAASTRSATAIALQPAQTLRLNRVDFEALLTEHSGLLRMVVQVLETRLRATSNNLVDALYLPVETRVYRRLSRLGAIYARGVIPLTQDDLASMVGTTRQSLNKVLRKAQDDGLLSLARGRISVTDLEGIVRRSH